MGRVEARSDLRTRRVSLSDIKSIRSPIQIDFGRLSPRYDGKQGFKQSQENAEASFNASRDFDEAPLPSALLCSALRSHDHDVVILRTAQGLRLRSARSHPAVSGAGHAVTST